MWKIGIFQFSIFLSLENINFWLHIDIIMFTWLQHVNISYEQKYLWIHTKFN